MTADVDVVIVAFANRGTIRSCVRQARAFDFVREVVVVDHGLDGSADIAESMGARVIHDPGNPGFGTGQNRGVAETHAPYVLLLNPDAAPEADGIAAGLALMNDNPQIGAAQGVIMNRATGAPERSSGRELGPVHLFGRAVGARRLLSWPSVRAVARRVPLLSDHVERVPARPTSVASLAATAVLVRRDAFVGVGGFDESYFLYGEDLDLCRRLRAAGWTLSALPEPFAWHEGGASAASLAERELTWWRGTMRFAALWWSPSAWFVALAAASIACIRLSVRQPRLAGRAFRALVREPMHDRTIPRPANRSASLVGVG